MKITLEAWAARHFDPPPALPTLRAWARSGHIQPAPVKVGRTWYVDSDATYTPAPAAPAGEVVAMSGRAAAIFRAAA
jgi:hypothetical protein